MFYELFAKLCDEKGVKPSRAAEELGISKGTVSYWKKQYLAGKDNKPDSYTAEKIADYFSVSVDYLLGRTDDPIDYDDGELLAEIPLSYMELAEGDAKKAYAIMKAADEDARQFSILSNLRDKFGAADANLLFALYGEEGAANITEEDIADIRNFAEFVKAKKESK